MPSDEYASSVRGSLKLKGATPTGITKKKKKKTSSKPVAVAEAEKQDKEKDDDEEDTSKGKKKQSRSARVDEEGADATEDLNDAELRELETRDREGDGKTASERAYEEMRRKRLHERLQKEGVKTHKQRVEELNKYLSGLSEHHDMPKIGPG